MSMKHALRLAIALQELKDIEQNKKLTQEKKFDLKVLELGGTTYWNRKVVKQTVDKKTGVVKSKEGVQKVKIVVLTDQQDHSDVSNKGKFSFRNACGNRIYVSVKSYKEADEFVAEVYGKGMYRVSSVVN